VSMIVYNCLHRHRSVPETALLYVVGQRSCQNQDISALKLDDYFALLNWYRYLKGKRRG